MGASASVSLGRALDLSLSAATDSGRLLDSRSFIKILTQEVPIPLTSGGGSSGTVCSSGAQQDSKKMDPHVIGN